MMMLRIYAFIFGLLFVSSSRALSAEIKNADCDVWVTDTVRVTDSKRADTDIILRIQIDLPVIHREVTP